MCLLIFSCNGRKANSVATHTGTKASKNFVSSQSKGLRTKNNVLFLRHKKFDGFLYRLYNNSKDTIFIESYSNGILDGISKKWYLNSKIMEIRYYSKGKKNGKQLAYFENEKKRFEFTAKNDQYEGELREWNVAGKLIHLATYENGQEEGTQKMWYDNGKIRANYVMKNGKRYGLLGTKNCINVSDSIFIIK